MTQSLLNSMAAQPVTRRRQDPGTWVDGVYQPGATSDLLVTICVQPAAGEDLISLPEGQRERETYKVYSEVELRTNNEGAGYKADQLLFYGGTYEVQQVMRQVGLGLDHYKAIVTKENL